VSSSSRRAWKARLPILRAMVSRATVVSRTRSGSPARGRRRPGLHPLRTMPKRVESRIVHIVNRSPLSPGEESATYIGPPRRIYVVEPLENPVPAKRPPRPPKEPAQPKPERVREPAAPAP
jgi:hypothetical protein